MLLSDQGRSREALVFFNGTVGEIGVRLSTVSNDWIAYEQEAATAAGRESVADRRRHYAIARGSAAEAGNAVEVAHLFGALSDEDRAAMRSRLLRVTWMLTAMIRR